MVSQLHGVPWCPPFHPSARPVHLPQEKRHCLPRSQCICFRAILSLLYVAQICVSGKNPRQVIHLHLFFNNWLCSLLCVTLIPFSLNCISNIQRHLLVATMNLFPYFLPKGKVFFFCLLFHNSLKHISWQSCSYWERVWLLASHLPNPLQHHYKGSESEPADGRLPLPHLSPSLLVTLPFK